MGDGKGYAFDEVISPDLKRNLELTRIGDLLEQILIELQNIRIVYNPGKSKQERIEEPNQSDL
jgi:hypothetical protein